MISFAACLPFKHLSAQCIEPEQPKVLLVGDSWAFFMGVDGTFNTVFRKWGHSNYKFLTNTIVAENGAETDDFLTASKQNEIKRLLDQNPSIKAVHLSIGGNDVLGDWNVNFTPQQTDSLRDIVSTKLFQIIEFIKSCRPGIRIVWSGYCYPNFGEVIPTSGLNNNHPFYGTWQRMGFPDFLTLNNLLNRFSREIDSVAKLDPQLEFVNATGLMQYTFGQTQPLGVPPGITYPPFSVPLPEGNPEYPSPRNSMRDYLLTKDCFHLSARGYLDLIEYQTRKFYHKFLMDDTFFLAQIKPNSGAVSSSGSVSDSLIMGNINGEQFSLLLSFNTLSLPDTPITKASVFLRRKNLLGSNPITNTLIAKIKSGNFGVSANVEPQDATDPGNASESACVFGSNGGNGHWIRVDLPPSFYPFIKSESSLQIMLTPSGTANGMAVFNDGTDPELAPVLNVAYFNPNTDS
ncbi:MAG: SGNH/GDSL hydrolase family protein, partial [Chitinophagales bacterium]|nr:SGNH/GDSL hydrolase family protein [Chitinophagales bacterium]